MREFMREYYLGIDLGTTNSLISWSTENHKGDIVTEVLNMDMIDVSGTVKSQLIPSYIFFDEKNIPVIGKKAKSMVSKQPDRVIKNAKSYMGENRSFTIGEKSVTPVEASAMILKFIGKAAEKQFGEYPKNVVITVPASFDTDKRLATIKAAELAGFNTKDEKGNSLEILLSEPRAALYDYVNLQNKNEIPQTIDFRKEKNIAVFDLGGGTLDVSIHSLRYGNDGNLDIKDLGISRYTEVGGTDFDKTVGHYLMENFIEKNKIKNLDDFQYSFLLDKFTEFAEEIKLELNSQIENIKMFGFGKENLDEVEAEIFKTSVLQGYNYTVKITLAQYKKIVKDLLAQELSMDNLNKIEEIEKTENIIYPILDAIKKANEKLGEKLVVDAVILNGGMTKFYPIAERVEQFFGMKPYSVLDQDKSVARGASVFHFRKNRGEKFEKIQNDTIGLGRAGEKVHHLIEAGTVLPVTKTISDFVIPQDSVRFIDLPFYLGSRTDIKSPNRKIAERRICFKEPMNQGELVTMEISVNEMGIMEIFGKAGKKRQEFTVKIDSEDRGIDNGHEVRIEKKNSTPQKYSPTGEFIEIDRVMKEFISLTTKYDKYHLSEQKARSMQSIKRIEGNVLSGTNGNHFLEELIKRYPDMKGTGKDRATYLLGEFGKNYPEYREKITLEFEKNIEIFHLIYHGKDLHKSLAGYVRFSVEGLRKIGAKISEEKLTDLVGNPLLLAIEFSLLMSIGALCKTPEALKKIQKYISLGSNEAAFWALGKFGSREREEIISIHLLEKSALEISGKLQCYKRKEILRNAIYALAEICDRRGSGDKISKESSIKILQNLNLITSKESSIVKILEVAKVVIKGEGLSQSQEKILLDLRVLL